MAKNVKLEFLKSNYTLRSKHKGLKNGSNVYERDFMVTTNNGGWDSGSIPYEEGNFKMVTRDDVSSKRKHLYGKPLKNGDSEFWTLDNVSHLVKSKKSITSNEGEFVSKPIYSSLLDFAYFGSSVELIKASLQDIIQKYPGEMYVTSSPAEYYDDGTDSVRTAGDEFGNLVLVSNPYNIDVYTKILTKNISKDLKNDLTYFCRSRDKYKILDPDGKPLCMDNRWIVKIDENMLLCHRNGTKVGQVILAGEIGDSGDVNAEEQFVIYIYYIDGELVYVCDEIWTGYHIRPIDSVVDKFYDELDDFEKFILNRDSNPLYTITIDYAEETDYGVKTSKRSFTWPTNNGWNLDITSYAYSNYVNDLLKLAAFYDEYYSDNMWRMMTHDSIKNMDLTFSNPSKDEDEYDYNIGTTKVQGLFTAIARQFDDIKRHIDDIKKVNHITYTQTNNVSDYLLSDNLELKGWEVYNPVATLDANTTVAGLYPSLNKEYTLDDVSSLFKSVLSINSKDIFKRKGTRAAIEMLLGMFGYCSYEYAKAKYMALPENLKDGKKWDDLTDKEKMDLYDYELNEFVSVMSNTPDDIYDIDEELPIYEFNALKQDYEAPYYDDRDAMRQGLPVREIVFSVEDGDAVSFKHYLIPWFDKNDKLDGETYFQMYGGWGELNFKKIDNELTNKIDKIYSNSQFKIYSETKKYLKIKNTLFDLLHARRYEVNVGDIYYVVESLADNPDYTSNYFILRNLDGMTSVGENGWENIPSYDIENALNDGLKVLYLESIIDTENGNNPHVGYGKYDNGDEYLNRFKQIFKYKIDIDNADEPSFVDEAYDCETGELHEEIKNAGFTVSDLVKDNMKTWYFTPTGDDGAMVLKKHMVSIEEEDVEISDGYVDSGVKEDVFVGQKSVEAGDTKLTSELNAFDLEVQESGSNDEASANSIINVKNLELRFNPKFSMIAGFSDYLYNVVIPYVSQIIPSTSLLRIVVDGGEATFACYPYAEITGVVSPKNNE